jgi:hypothetical protein
VIDPARHVARRTGPRRAGVALAAALALGGAGLAGCTDDGDQGAFCDRLADTPALGETLGALDSSDPGGARRQLEDAARQFRLLESDAPGEVREDVARVRQGVDLILDAIEDNPDDIAAAREAITGQADELVGLASAASDVVAYAERECDLTLESFEPAGGGTDPAGTTPTSDPSSTTTGG